MRIAYIADWNVSIESGVLTKMVAQTEHWLKFGHQARLFLLSPGSGVVAPEACSPFVHVEFVGAPGLLPAKVKKIGVMPRLRRAVDAFAPDLIYYRDASWTPGIISILSSARSLIIEINSLNDQAVSGVSPLVRLFNETTKSFILSRCDALVCVSGELAAAFAGLGKPVDVIANGYAIDPSATISAPANTRAQIATVVSNGSIWHGVDKFAALAARLPEYDFHIYGIQGRNSTENLFYHGRLGRSELAEAYARTDIGMGTLGLHRKTLEEASPLKVREYLGHGIPVIGAYRDTDLSGQDFYLELPNTETGVTDSIGEIRAFIETWRGKRVGLERAANLIGAGAKERRRLEFFRQVLEARQHSA